MNIAQHVLVGAIRLYRMGLSPLQSVLFGAGAGCRYTPTCSAYGMDAIRKHGALKGLALILLRLARCHPWGGCGHDPVPDRFTVRAPRLAISHRSRLKAHGS